MRVLFLYTELADYFLKCCEELAKSAEVHIVRWPVNKEAPFQFEYPAGVKVHDKEKYPGNRLNTLVEEIDPGMVVCSGWIDKDYLRIAGKYFEKIPTVLACDTHWKGSFRQRLAVSLSRFTLLRIFSHAWVPGQPQETYVKKLGFKKERIHTGFYCCDLSRFNEGYKKQFPEKKKDFPRRFLFVGRYYEFKGVKELWEAFISLQKENSGWELWCLGAGDIEPLQHERIRHFGFVQPRDLLDITKQCGVFVLPSRFEPWGVVVQEYAAGGFPLLLSTAVGASQTFLADGENGFSFSPGRPDSIREALKKIMNLSSKELILMAERSHERAQRITPVKWAATVKEIYEDKKK